MSNKLKIKVGIDILMTILILILMAYSITGQQLHEYIGVSVFILFAVHNILNRRWYKNLLKGRYNSIRLFQTIINLLLVIIVMGLIVSGIILSSYIFSSLNISGGTALARSIHLVASYWCFIIISMHIGLHWGMVTSRLKKIPQKIIITIRVIATIIAVYGGYLFIYYKIFDYMLLRTQFAMGYEKSAVLFVVEYLAILICFAYIAYYISKLLRRDGLK